MGSKVHIFSPIYKYFYNFLLLVFFERNRNIPIKLNNKPIITP